MGRSVERDEVLGSLNPRRFVRLGPSARVPAAQVGWASQRESARTFVDERREDRLQSGRIEDIVCPCHTPGVPAGGSDGAHCTSLRFKDPHSLTSFHGDAGRSSITWIFELCFPQRFTTLQSCPQCVRGRFRQSCRKALEARRDAANSETS